MKIIDWKLRLESSTVTWRKTDVIRRKKMKRRIVAGLLMLTMCASLFTGCGKSESKDASAGEAGGGELHVAISANPPALDPPVANSNIVGGIGIHVYEPLFAMNESYEPTPVLAESYEVSADGSVYTVKIREGVKFHNGDEVKAEDVVASMAYWLEHSAKANTLIGGTTFEKVDDYTVDIKVNEPASDILMVLASPIQFAAIYPEEVVASAGESGITEFVGTGPYEVAEWKQDQYVCLEKYDEYQASPDASTGIAGKKNAYADTIYFDVVTDAATRIAGVQSGQYDFAQEIPADNYAELKEDANITLTTNSGGTINLFLNTTKGIMANQDMRQAVLAALNCEDILTASYGDSSLFVVNAGWCNPSDAQWGTDAGKEYYNQNDPEKAKELLEKAGYNGEKLVLVTTPDYAEMYNATLVVQEQLKQAGINAEVESYDFSTFMEHRANPDQFSMYITSNSYNMLPIQLSVLDSGWAGLDAPEVAEGISAIRFADDEEQAAKAWQDLQSFLYEYGAATVLGHYTGINASKASAEGYEYLRFPIYWNATVSE